MTGITSKLVGYKNRAVYEWKQHHHRSRDRKRNAIFNVWLDQLAENPPDVLVGANFAGFGGVRHHIQAIQRYSSMNVEFVPSEQLMNKIGVHYFTNDFRERFLRFPARNIKAVHSHVFPWFIEWCRERQKAGMRWVHTYHLNYYPEHSNHVLEPWQKEINHSLLQVAKFADVRLSVSKWQVEELRQEHGIESWYLPNGVDVSLCDKAVPARFKDKTGLENFILYVGRNAPVKNPAEFLKLAAFLPDFSFVMIGNDLEESALERDWELDVPPNVSIFGEFPHATVQDAIAACSILVVTSKREGLPTLVMEAMAQAKPVVVPDEAGCMEVVGYGEVGFVYRLGDIEDLAENCLKALNTRKIGSKARMRVIAKYDWKVVAPKLDAIYAGHDCD